MKVSRRKALKATAVAALAGSAIKLGGLEAKPSGREPRYGMVIDLRKCFGCHACSIACKAEQSVPLGCFKSWVITAERGAFPNARRLFIPVLCNQCENPPCVEGCPTGATWQQADGIVMQDEESCIGCSYCVQACPYGAKYLDPVTETAQKCDFCAHRVDQGLLPACVNTCNAQARVFGDLNDPASAVSKLIAKNHAQPLRPHMGTEPRVFYINLEADAYEPLVGRVFSELSGQAAL